MKRVLSAMLIVLGAATPGRAYIDSAPTLGKLTADSNNVLVHGLKRHPVSVVILG